MSTVPNLVPTIGRRVVELRDRHRMSQAGLAERAGLNKSTLRVIEHGTATGLHLYTVAALAQALQVPIGVLLGERPIPVVAHWATPLARALVEAEQILKEVA